LFAAIGFSACIDFFRRDRLNRTPTLLAVIGLFVRIDFARRLRRPFRRARNLLYTIPAARPFSCFYATNPARFHKTIIAVREPTSKISYESKKESNPPHAR
jgi:hypothetical protein